MPWGILQVVTILLRRARTTATTATNDQHPRHRRASCSSKSAKPPPSPMPPSRSPIAPRISKPSAPPSAKTWTKAISKPPPCSSTKWNAASATPRKPTSSASRSTTTSRAAIDQRVADTVEHVELLLITRSNGPTPQRESDRLLRLFPTHPDARKLAGRIQIATDDHKRELLKTGRKPSPRMTSTARWNCCAARSISLPLRSRSLQRIRPRRLPQKPPAARRPIRPARARQKLERSPPHRPPDHRRIPQHPHGRRSPRTPADPGRKRPHACGGLSVRCVLEGEVTADYGSFLSGSSAQK